jgi:hypothetical protein
MAVPEDSALLQVSCCAGLDVQCTCLQQPPLLQLVAAVAAAVVHCLLLLRFPYYCWAF